MNMTHVAAPESVPWNSYNANPVSPMVLPLPHLPDFLVLITSLLYLDSLLL